MKPLPILIICLTLTGCSTLGSRQSNITLPSGETYVINSQHDAKFEFQDYKVKISVDNRGNRSLFDNLTEAVPTGIAGVGSSLLNNSVNSAVIK